MKLDALSGGGGTAPLTNKRVMGGATPAGRLKETAANVSESSRAVGDTFRQKKKQFSLVSGPANAAKGSGGMVNVKA